MKGKKLFILFALILVVSLVAACAKPAPAPAPAPAPMPTPTPALESRVSELEAKIRQLEAENQRLRTENQQLNSDLAKLSNWLQDIHDIVTSSSYTKTFSKLTDIQYDTTELGAFIPDLPPLPPELTVSQIDDAINKARYLRTLLKRLPPPPPLAPTVWSDLDDMKDEFIRMTDWMENLQDLPGFLRSAESLEDLRFRLEGYLQDVDNTASDASGILEEVRKRVSSVWM